MTGLDWLIVAFALAMGLWGYQQGLIVGLLSLGGFAIGAFLGSRLGPALLPEGSHSPYAPATALAGAFLIGGIVAVSLEGVAFGLRRRLLGAAEGHRGVAIAEASGGTALLVAGIFAITDSRNSPAPAGLAPVVVGLLVVLIGATFGFNAGYAINPARDFGPRLFTFVAGWGGEVFRAGNQWWWVPIVAPCVGGVAGGWIYDACIGHRFPTHTSVPQTT